MALNDDLQSVYKNQLEMAASLARKLAGNASKIVNEVQDITATSVQAQAAFELLPIGWTNSGVI
ncbi:hypothetical protein [Rhodoblastus sp.]|uniref:hypothetical protein n=1 Tax=Rhodoblastus sp. TaxID=1962975 RepID=UPI0025D67D37|nr:hypothetical protein [Rhodoblastus sp.]